MYLSAMYNLIDYQVSVRNIIEKDTIRMLDDNKEVDIPVAIIFFFPIL